MAGRSGRRKAPATAAAVEVVWTDAALADIESVYGYLVRFNPIAAASIVETLRDAANGLTNFPERGRPVGPKRRDLTTEWPYVIQYRIARERVIILRIRHGRRRPLGT